MSDITTRSGKGLPLTHDEVDANFTNLNTDKYESGDSATFSSVTVINGLTVNNDALYVDSVNDKVGINEDSNLDAALVVRDGAYTIDRDGGVLIQHGDSTGNHVRAGFKLKSNGSGAYRTVIDAASNVGGTLAAGHTTETLSIAAGTGNIGIPIGNGDGYGITFNSTDHAASTTLDYYEEGTWTPEIATSTTGGSTATPGSVNASYTRIGNVVTCSVYLLALDISGLSTASTVYLRNLPFVFSGSASQAFPVASWSNITLPSLGTSIHFAALPTTSAAIFRVNKSSGSVSSLKFGDLDAGGTSDFIFNFTYLTNT